MSSHAVAADGTPLNYINCEKGIWSWMTTIDHKRIALMYLFSITIFFFMGGIAALLMRTELAYPRETPDLAATRLRKFHDLYRNPAAADTAWSFLVGEKTNIDILMKSLGFNFLKDGTEYAHAPVFMILTPEGQISQYFTGITFSPWDVRLALVEASEGRIGSPIDHFLLFCFRFDPTKGRYSWAAWNFLRIGSVLSVVLCGLIVFIYSRKKN